MHRTVLCLVLTLLVLPGVLAAEQPWAIHATDELQPSTAEGLEEVYVASSLDNLPEANNDMVRWTWWSWSCLLYTSPSPRDKRQSRMPSSA